MKWDKTRIDPQPLQVGPHLVRRVPASSAVYSAIHKQYWRGYLFPLMLPVKWIEKFGKLIEVRTTEELDAECEAFRASLKPEAGTRLAYYEVIDARTV